MHDRRIISVEIQELFFPAPAYTYMPNCVCDVAGGGTCTRGLCICGFPSGPTGASSQEIVLEYPRGYRAIGFRVEKKKGERGRRRQKEGRRKRGVRGET